MPDESRALQPLFPQDSYTIEQVIAAWLNAKRGRSGSLKTIAAYEATLTDFRLVLHAYALDLDSPTSRVSLLAQGWAEQRDAVFASKGPIASATFNQRLAILSSFYAYARKHHMLSVENPIDLVERRVVQPYQGAHPLDSEDVRSRLLAIDRSTTAGLRDYALLSLALHTGRRAGELAGLRWKHLRFSGGKKVMIHWPPTKGGKEMRDELGAGVSKALLDYLHAAYGAELGSLDADAPVWRAYTRNAYQGGMITARSISNIYKKHLGVSKIHATRHTFAKAMEEQGATVSEIAGRLGHTSVATTTKYLHVLNSAHNPHMHKLENLFGVSAQEEDS